MAIGAVLASIAPTIAQTVAKSWSRSKESANRVKEYTAEKLTGREGWVVALVFGVWAAPVVVTMFDPEQGHAIAGAIAAMPGDYVETFENLTYVAIGAPVLLRAMKP